ncbi:hypothetical protein HK405_015826 [Cladochytrium tenue]|nr:hypothetical protein HK405_015826 [Cladochytrium tenue]
MKPLPLNQELEVLASTTMATLQSSLPTPRTWWVGSIQKTQEQSAAGGGGGGGTKSSHEIVVEVATDILARIPNTFSIETAAQRYPVNYNESMKWEGKIKRRLFQSFRVHMCPLERDIKEILEKVGAIHYWDAAKHYVDDS